MIIYDNEFETKENKIWTKDKIEPQRRHLQMIYLGLPLENIVLLFAQIKVKE